MSNCSPEIVTIKLPVAVDECNYFPTAWLTKCAITFFFFLIFANLIGEKLYLIIVLIWTCFYSEGLTGVRQIQCSDREWRVSQG